MRHGNNKRKFGRVRKVRQALLVSLALNLIIRGKIKTTKAKAKELRPFMEKLVTLAKRGEASRRIAVATLANRRPETKKLFQIIAPKYADRKGGYTRVLKLGARVSDGAPMAVIAFV